MKKDIQHHLSDELIAGYAAGTLPEAVNLIVATHISLCDTCRAALGAHEALGGAVLEQTQAEELEEGCLSGALDLIRNGAWAATEPRVVSADPVLPAPLSDYVGGSLDDIRWRHVGMGVRQSVLETSRDATARLLYIPAGMAVPDHGHTGLELTLVLQGAFSDEDGRYARGDIEIADADLEHKPVADLSEDCICLAVTDAPLQFKGLVPRLLQPFLDI